MPKPNMPFGFYDIDTPYLESMQKIDRYVPDSDYDKRGQERKFYLGPVFEKDGVDFYVPISSKTRIKMNRDTGKDIKQRMLIPNNDNSKVCDLDFRHMVPCINTELTTLIVPRPICSDEKCKSEQLNFCKRPDVLAKIKEKARSTYRDKTIYADLQSVRVWEKSCCDFEKVTAAMQDYLDTKDRATRTKNARTAMQSQKLSTASNQAPAEYPMDRFQKTTLDPPKSAASRSKSDERQL